MTSISSADIIAELRALRAKMHREFPERPYTTAFVRPLPDAAIKAPEGYLAELNGDLRGIKIREVSYLPDNVAMVLYRDPPFGELPGPRDMVIAKNGDA